MKGNIEYKILRTLILLDFMKQINFYIHILVIEVLGRDFDFMLITFF